MEGKEGEWELSMKGCQKQNGGIAKGEREGDDE